MPNAGAYPAAEVREILPREVPLLERADLEPQDEVQDLGIGAIDGEPQRALDRRIGLLVDALLDRQHAVAPGELRVAHQARDDFLGLGRARRERLPDHSGKSARDLHRIGDEARRERATGGDQEGDGVQKEPRAPACADCRDDDPEAQDDAENRAEIHVCDPFAAASTTSA